MEDMSLLCGDTALNQENNTGDLLTAIFGFMIFGRKHIFRSPGMKDRISGPDGRRTANYISCQAVVAGTISTGYGSERGANGRIFSKTHILMKKGTGIVLFDWKGWF